MTDCVINPSDGSSIVRPGTARAAAISFSQRCDDRHTKGES